MRSLKARLALCEKYWPPRQKIFVFIAPDDWGKPSSIEAAVLRELDRRNLDPHQAEVTIVRCFHRRGDELYSGERHVHRFAFV